MLCWLRRLEVMETTLRMHCQLMRVRCCSSLLLSPGNWGSAIAKIVGINTKKAFFFQDEVQMYVYEEIYKGRKLHELINETHENPKYLPGIALPQNIRAVSNIREVVANAHVLIFVRWHTTLRVNRREGVCGNEDSRRDRGRVGGKENGREGFVCACLLSQCF